MEMPVIPPRAHPPCERTTTALRGIFLHVTKACNLRCTYCYFSASKPLPDEMTSSEFRALWPDIVALAPAKVIFTGGEPLLRPDILDLLRGLRDADPAHRVLRCLNTNGHRVTNSLANDLVGLADEVRVSVDALAVRNDAHRGAGNFRAAMRALEIYHAAGFEPKALVTVTSATLPDLEDLLRHLILNHITRINLNPFRPLGRGSEHADWMVPPHAVEEALQRAWATCFPDRPIAPAPLESDTQNHCGVGQFVNIMPNGEVFPCHALTAPAFRCGNVRTQSLRDICRRDSLLGRLARVNFGDLAQQEEGLRDLTRPRTCLGIVHARTEHLPIWRRLERSAS